MPVSEAQKRAIKKYQQNNKDKLRESAKRYYHKKKEQTKSIKGENKHLRERIRELESDNLRKIIKSQRMRIARMEDLLTMNDFDPHVHPNDYEDETGHYLFNPEDNTHHHKLFY